MHKPALITFSPDYEDCLVFFRHFSHGRVTTNELAWTDFKLELVRQLNTSLLLRFSATVRDKYIRPARYQHRSLR